MEFTPMAIRRMISKSLSTSKKFAELEGAPLGEFAQKLYMLLLCHGDDFGRFAGDAFTVKHTVVPTSARTLDEVEQALERLTGVALVQRYAVDGRSYLQLVDWDRHQRGLHKRTTSLFPEPP